MTDEEIKKKFRDLVKKLYAKTMSSEVSWDQSIKNEIVAQVGDLEICLKSSKNADGEPLEIVEIREPNGRVLDSFTDEFVAGTAPTAAGFPNYYSLMVALHQTARRRALGVDVALDKLLKDLS